MKEKHNKMNMGLVFFVVTLFVVSSGMSAIGNVIKDDDEKNYVIIANDETVNVGTIRVGDNWVEATAIDVTVDLGPNGGDLVIEADYNLNLPGWCDDGSAAIGIWGESEPRDYVITGESASSDTDPPLSFTIQDCEPGEKFWIRLEGTYTDCINGEKRDYDKSIITVQDYDPSQKGDIALIVECGLNDGLQSSFDRTADLAEGIFRDNLGYGEHLVKRLKKPTKTEFRSSLREMAKKLAYTNHGGDSNIFIYVVDHGVGRSAWNDLFEILSTKEGAVVLNPDQDLLTWSDLGAWLSEIREDIDHFPTYNKCTIVIEACFSGEWVRTGSSLQRDNHIIITSTDWDHVAWAKNGGCAIFSEAFFNALKDGQTSYGEAWEIADAVVYSEMKYQYGQPHNKEYTIKDFFEKIIQECPGGSLFNLLNRFVQFKRQGSSIISNDMRPLFGDLSRFEYYYDYDNGELRAILRQSPVLSDNGNPLNSAGTTSSNKKDTLPDGGNGNLALQVIPTPQGD